MEQRLIKVLLRLSERITSCNNPDAFLDLLEKMCSSNNAHLLYFEPPTEKTVKVDSEEENTSEEESFEALIKNQEPSMLEPDEPFFLSSEEDSDCEELKLLKEIESPIVKVTIRKRRRPIDTMSSPQPSITTTKPSTPVKKKKTVYVNSAGLESKRQLFK